MSRILQSWVFFVVVVFGLSSCGGGDGFGGDSSIGATGNANLSTTGSLGSSTITTPTIGTGLIGTGTIPSGTIGTGTISTGSITGNTTGLVPQQPVAGFWSGQFTSSAGFNSGVVGVISDLGEVLWVYHQFNNIVQVVEGRLRVTGQNVQGLGLGIDGTLNSVSLNGLTYVNNQSTITTQVAGTVLAQQQLTLNETYNNQAYGVYSLAYDNAYENPSSLSLIAGNYSSFDNGITTAYNIDGAGNLSGGNSAGCIFSGSVSIINGNYNLYRVSNNVSNCGNSDGVWQGFAGLTGSGNLNDSMLLIIKTANDVAVEIVYR